MTPPVRSRRPRIRRAVILFPSGLTLGNLFFGVFAIIAASRNDFVQAGVYVLLGGIFDVLDGRVARATNAGSQFGEELDSLVDAITFGLAPAMIVYFAVFNHDGWDWIWVFLFAACAVLRLARFNIEQAGTAKTYFQGLPSPAAGITLASYYWFSQSWLYNYGAVADLKWHVLLRFLMAFLAFLMVSNVPYPTFPRTGFRSPRAIGATVLLVGSIVLLVMRRLEFFFPMAIIYVAWGLVRTLFFRLFERQQPTLPYDLSEGEDDEEDEEYIPIPLGDSLVHGARQGHRDLRPPREDREARPPRERGSRTGSRTERPPRAEKSDAPARPVRTEEEKAERREKREKRAERDRARIERAQAAPVAVIAPSDETVGTTDPDDDTLSLVGDLPGGANNELPAADGAPARKRKRRRRRGERRPAGASEGEAGDDGGESDAGESPPSTESGVSSEEGPSLPAPSVPPRTETASPYRTEGQE